MSNIPPTHNEKAFGDWETEAEAAAELDRRLESSGMFERIYREVPGHYLARRPGRELKDARIDRVLVPGRKLRDAGWTRTIGIEIKRSGEDIGPAIAQAIDYTYCTWHVRGVDVWLYCERIFLWPFKPQLRAIESVITQNGVGVLYDKVYSNAEWNRPLVFELERQVISVNSDWSIDKCVDTNAGRKMGSR